MIQIANWGCLFAICFLVLEMMVYFCKDTINIFEESKKNKVVYVGNTKVNSLEYKHQNKIAK